MIAQPLPYLTEFLGNDAPAIIHKVMVWYPKTTHFLYFQEEIEYSKLVLLDKKNKNINMRNICLHIG